MDGAIEVIIFTFLGKIHDCVSKGLPHGGLRFGSSLRVLTYVSRRTRYSFSWLGYYPAIILV